MHVFRIYFSSRRRDELVAHFPANMSALRKTQRSSKLNSSKNWIAPFAISRYRLLMVRRRERDSLPAKVLLKKLAVRHVEAHIQEYFGLPAALRADAQILLDQRVYTLVKFIRHDQVIDESYFKRSPAVDILAGQCHRFGPSEADIARQPERAQSRDDAFLYRRESKLTLVGRDADVTQAKANCNPPPSTTVLIKSCYYAWKFV
jgi:hypothetical protein